VRKGGSSSTLPIVLFWESIWRIIMTYKVLKPFESGLLTNLVSRGLTEDYLKSLLHYNHKTGVFTWLKSRGRVSVGTVAGILQPDGYRYIKIDKKNHLEHRLAWFYVTNCFPCGDQNFIDHINGNKSDNRFENLRVCSDSENKRNRGKQMNNTNKFKGVSYDKRRGKYYARVTNPLTKKQENLGSFKTQEEASLVYEAKSQEYFGEFYPDKLINQKGNK
jgi:hypothetical protein